MFNMKKKRKLSLNNTRGGVSFTGIVLAVILIVTVLVLFFLLKEVLKEEKVILTIQAQDSVGDPLAGVEIFIDDIFVASTDSLGEYQYIYSASDEGKTISIKATIDDYQELEVKRLLGINPVMVPLTMLRPFADITFTTIDSISNKPVKGVDIYVAGEKIGTTGSDGILAVPSNTVRLHDLVYVQLEGKRYNRKTESVDIASLDYNKTFEIVKKKTRARRPRPKKKQPLPPVISVIETPEMEFKSDAPVPIKAVEENSDDTTHLIINSAFNLYKDKNYRSALDDYNKLTSMRRWSARADFWLYSADCAIHLSGDKYGRYNRAILDSALTFLENAQRYEAYIKGDVFSALVKIKVGETYAYLCETQIGVNHEREAEFRNKADLYLSEGLTMLTNQKLNNTDLYKFALSLRDDVGQY
ncbi:MAG: hypothetical protein J7K40_03745 [candidate division Zixibacteria bacterium]|nr:hypothetical protein [candidate division Zixibacteria bacterium]